MDAYILDAKRTPIGRSHPDRGIYRSVRADELMAQLLVKVGEAQAVREASEDILIGCVGQHLEQGKNIARLAALLAGFPERTAGVTINRLCGSSLQAFNFAAMALHSGQNEVLMAGGVEHMLHVPMQAAIDYNQNLLGRYEFPFTQMGMTAERVASLHGISRREQDEYSLLSHQRAVRAQREGLFKSQIVPVETPLAICDTDQGPRVDASLETLSGLKAAFMEGGTVTAGNSSPISDGASLCLMASAAGAKKLAMKVRARVEAVCVVGVDPLLMGMGPVPAIQGLLRRMKMEIGDVDAFEINEAFASQVIACLRQLNITPEKVNANGGAIALGHPLGCTGTRLVTSLLHEMERSDLEVGIAALCVGHGQGMATMIRRGKGVS